MVAHLPKLSSIAFFGFLYDVFGRRIPLQLGLIFTGIAIINLPLIAPSLEYFVFFFLLINILIQAVISQPLNIDYVLKQSQGKVVALGQMGEAFGNMIAAIIFFYHPDNFDIPASFTTIGVIILIFGVITPFIIIEAPDIK